MLPRIAEVSGWEDGLSRLEALPLDRVENYQPYWALKAYLLKQSGRLDESQKAYSQAIGLTEDAAIRSFLLHQSR